MNPIPDKDSEKKLICFIDDSAEERELFEKVFGAEEGALRVFCAETFAEAAGKINDINETPDLFVLDLYFPLDINTERKPVQSIGPITLPGDEGDLLKAFMNVETVQKRYRTIREAEGQSPAGGYRLIEQVQEAYPGIPMVSYTRKGTIEEAEQARKTGARRVLQKPSGEDWKKTLELNLQLREELEKQFLRVIYQDPFEILNLIGHYSTLFDHPEDRTKIARETLTLRRKLLQSDEEEVNRDDVDLLMTCTNHLFVRALIYQLRPDGV